MLRLIFVYFEAMSGLHRNWNESHLFAINFVLNMELLSQILGGGGHTAIHISWHAFGSKV